MEPKEPTLSLFNVTTRKSTFVICVMEDFYPKIITVQWKVNGTSQRQSKIEYSVNDDGLYTAKSFYKVNSETWILKTEFTCEVTHQEKLFSEKKMLNGKSFKSAFLL